MKAGKDKVLEEIKAIRNMLGGSERVSPMQDPSHPMHIKEVTPEFREKKAEISDELLAGQNKELEKTVKELTGTLKEMKKEGDTPENIRELEHGLNQAKRELKEGGLLAAERAGEAAAKKRETIAAEKEEKKQAAAKKEKQAAEEKTAKGVRHVRGRKAQHDAAQERAKRQKQTDVDVASQRKLDALRTKDDPDHYTHIDEDSDVVKEFEKDWEGKSDLELKHHIRRAKDKIDMKVQAHRAEKGHSTEEKLEHLKGLNELQRSHRIASLESERRKEKRELDREKEEKLPVDQEEKAAQEQAEQKAEEEGRLAPPTKPTGETRES